MCRDPGAAAYGEVDERATQELRVGADPVERVMALAECVRVVTRGREDAGVHRVRLDDERLSLVPPADGDLSRNRRSEERAAVDPPRHVDPEDVGDRWQDVGRPRGSAVDVSAPPVRILDDQRHGGDVGDVRGRDKAPRAARGEARAVICGHDDERTVVDARLLQSTDERGDQSVRVTDLEQVALERLRHENGRRSPVVEGVVEDSVDRDRVAVLAARGQKAERDVRKLEVDEVERPFGLAPTDAVEERPELRARTMVLALEREVDIVDVQRAEEPVARPAVGVVAEAAPAIADRR